MKLIGAFALERKRLSFLENFSLIFFAHVKQNNTLDQRQRENATPRALRRPRLNARRQHHRLSRFLRAR